MQLRYKMCNCRSKLFLPHHKWKTFPAFALSKSSLHFGHFVYLLLMLCFMSLPGKRVFVSLLYYLGNLQRFICVWHNCSLVTYSHVFMRFKNLFLPTVTFPASVMCFFFHSFLINTPRLARHCAEEFLQKPTERSLWEQILVLQSSVFVELGYSS